MHHHRHDPREIAALRQEFARSRGPRYGRRGRGGMRARRGDVRAAILALLAERPMHGYEMIKELEERTQGAWTPSAGSIYPTLQMLEDEGLVRGEESEGKRRFALTDAGQTEQTEKAGEQTPWDAVRADAAPEAINLKDSMGKLNHAIAQSFHAADEGQQQRVRELLDETRRKIYAILAEEG
ncbi:MAG TPA: PadR family transcriptional regulator [Solirubrobacterales bacterium]|nr:PadR family transcriptional regulator [Solirubrobacterales bacterium]